MVYFVCFQAFHVSFFVYFSTYLITHATYCKWKKYSWQQNCDENNVEWKLVLQLEIFFHNFSISCLKTLSDGLFNAFFFCFSTWLPMQLIANRQRIPGHKTYVPCDENDVGWKNWRSCSYKQYPTGRIYQRRPG